MARAANISPVNIRIERAKSFRGAPTIPGDKSISHRGLLFGALASGKTEIKDILESEDVQSTARCLKNLGVTITKKGSSTWVEGKGFKGLKEPIENLDCGNSGTTMRLLMGLLAGQSFTTTLSGDSSLSGRPMKRVSESLELMGARFELSGGNYAPLKVTGATLHGISYELKVASAQIKSAILLAALQAEGETVIRGQIGSRDHTERLLKYFGAKLEVSDSEIRIMGGQNLVSKQLQVPGDPSTAAFWMAAAALIPKSELTLENICLNPTRIGFMNVLRSMGADISVELDAQEPEPIGRIRIRPKELRGILVSKKEIPTLIDEIPILAVVATQARGRTEVQGAEELRVKESDRLEAVAKNLRAMGVKIDLRHDGFVIDGPQEMKGAEIETFEDHRIAMAFSVAALVAKGSSTISHPECVAISYPNFFKDLKGLSQNA